MPAAELERAVEREAGLHAAQFHHPRDGLVRVGWPNHRGRSMLSVRAGGAGRGSTRVERVRTAGESGAAELTRTSAAISVRACRQARRGRSG